MTESLKGIMQQADASRSLDYPLVIVGGGMAGALCALCMARLGLRVALIEAVLPEALQSQSFDQRAVALSDASLTIFQTLGIWRELEPIATPIETIHVSDAGQFGFARLNASEFGKSVFGQVIPLDETGPLLWKMLQSEVNVTLFCPARLIALTHDDQQIALTIQSVPEGKIQTLTAKLAVAADGTFSAVARLFGVSAERKSYGQQAVIANVVTQQAHNNRAFERFTPSGPLALLPLSGQRMSLVWCQKDANIQTVMDWDDATFTARLQKAFGYRLGKIIQIGKRAHYPLALHLLKPSFDKRVIFIGNAAHTLHPIAGQGFNLGLRDIASLVDHLATRETLQDIGAADFLASYYQARQTDWQQTLLATDSFARLFSNDFLPLVLIRNQAIASVNLFSCLRKQLVSAAMGYSGRSSLLARGILPWSRGKPS